MSAPAARKATRAGLSVFKLWTTDAGTFPVMFCASVGAIGCTITAVHAITKSPDVRIDKDNRRNALSFNEENGKVWRANRVKFANYDRNPINQSRQYEGVYEREAKEASK